MTGPVRFWSGDENDQILGRGVGRLVACSRRLPACGPRPRACARRHGAPPLIAAGRPVRRAGALTAPSCRRAATGWRSWPRATGSTNLWVLSVGAMDEAARRSPTTGIAASRAFRWAADSATLALSAGRRRRRESRGSMRSTPAGGRSARADAGRRARRDHRPSASRSGRGDRVAQPARRGLARYVAHRCRQRRAHADAAQCRRGRARLRALLRRSRQSRALGLQTLRRWRRRDVRAPLQGGRWTSLFAIPFEDAHVAQPLAFDADGRSFLMLDSTGRDRAALVRVDAATGVKDACSAKARAPMSPTSGSIRPPMRREAFAAEYLRREWRALDPDAQADIDFLDRQLTGDFSVVSRSADDARWIVVEDGPTTPARSYLYDRGDRANRRLSLLFRHRPNLEQAPLQAMTPVEIEARDGLTLVSYLTLPTGLRRQWRRAPGSARAAGGHSAHDGPWARDRYGFNAMHQWLANRGYAVLSVNFRGSTGFGKAFLNAGNREWGGKHAGRPARRRAMGDRTRHRASRPASPSSARALAAMRRSPRLADRRSNFAAAPAYGGAGQSGGFARATRRRATARCLVSARRRSAHRGRPRRCCASVRRFSAPAKSAGRC